MKKVVLGLFTILLLSGAAYTTEVYNTNSDTIHEGVITLQTPFYTKYYSIDPVNITAKFRELRDQEYKQLSREQKKTYKEVRKIEKFIAKKDFEKALKKDSSFLPTHIQYMNYLLSQYDLSGALAEMNKIKSLNNNDKILQEDIINYKLGMLYYLNRDYPTALSILTPFADKQNPSVDNLWFALADIHFNLNNSSTSIFYAKKVSEGSANYAAAQVLLYNNYYNLNNFKTANSYDQKLVKIDPGPINYMRLGTTSSDEKTKLLNYYKAHNSALASKNYTALVQADMRIAEIEQKKINNAVNTLSGFVEKPDWFKIAKEIDKMTEPLDLSLRQQEFFKMTNNCIGKYKDTDLIKCFEYVNREQDKISNEVKAKYQKAMEDRRQRELEYQRRQMLIQQQNFYDRIYMDSFFYMRHPFFWGYW